MACRVFGSEKSISAYKTDDGFVPSLDSDPQKSPYVFVSLDNGITKVKFLHSEIFEVCLRCPAYPQDENQAYGLYKHPFDLKDIVPMRRCQPLPNQFRICTNACINIRR